MIKLNDAELTSVLPDYIKSDVDVQSISYAFRKGMSKMLTNAQYARMCGDIDTLPEALLDLMAIELQSQYYDESMDVKIKREIIKNTLAWYTKGGTVSTVAEMVQAVFGEGKVVEWFDFGGVPGTFFVETSAELSPNGLNEFQGVIEKVKNSRSHLINVKITRKIEQVCPVIISGYITRIMTAKVGGESNV